MFRGSVMVLALILSAPALWEGFVSHQLSTDAALTRTLIAIPLAALLLAVIRMCVSGYGRMSGSKDPDPDQQ